MSGFQGLLIYLFVNLIWWRLGSILDILKEIAEHLEEGGDNNG